MSVAQAPRLARPDAGIERRAKDVAAAAAYIGVGLPVALAELLAAVPILLANPREMRRIAALERRLANSLLHARLPP